MISAWVHGEEEKAWEYSALAAGCPGSRRTVPIRRGRENNKEGTATFQGAEEHKQAGSSRQDGQQVLVTGGCSYLALLSVHRGEGGGICMGCPLHPLWTSP